MFNINGQLLEQPLFTASLPVPADHHATCGEGASRSMSEDVMDQDDDSRALDAFDVEVGGKIDGSFRSTPQKERLLNTWCQCPSIMAGRRSLSRRRTVARKYVYVLGRNIRLLDSSSSLL
jgi:hypothetical protein